MNYKVNIDTLKHVGTADMISASGGISSTAPFVITSGMSTGDITTAALSAIVDYQIALTARATAASAEVSALATAQSSYSSVLPSFAAVQNISDSDLAALIAARG